MFIERITLSPGLGKGRELRALAEERIKKLQGQGREISFAARMFGDAIGSLVVTLRFNDLAELEKRYAQNAADKDTREFVGKVSSMATTKAELLEVIVPFPKS